MFLPKRGRKDYILDKLHRGFVQTCMAVTVVSGLMLGYKVYEYFRYIRPVQQQLTKQAEEVLLAEGRHNSDTADGVVQEFS